MARKATRGAGYAWGLAEETGKAARWLCAHRLPGLPVLAALLALNDGKPYGDIAPAGDEDVWRAASGVLCPLIAGVALADRCDEIARGRVIRLAQTAYPFLITPFLGRAATYTGTAFALSLENEEIVCSERGVHADMTEPHLHTSLTESVTCMVAPVPAGLTAERDGSVEIDAPTWARLNAFAQRTYVPASEGSRLSGAGAGLIDND